jgi:hypothetical protein
MGFGPSVLVAPEPAQARRCPQFPRLRALFGRHLDGAPEAAFRLGPVRPQQLAREPMQLRFEPAFPAPVHLGQCLPQQAQRLGASVRPVMGLGRQCKEIRQEQGSARKYGRNRAAPVAR